MSTWEERLKAVMGGSGYENSMRRSLQSVILYEAKRCVAPRLSSLRPFQRKLAFIDQAHALVDTLDFLFPHQKQEILWRTATSKEALNADMAWKRERLVERELANLSKEIKPFLGRGRSHQECCDMLVQMLFVSTVLYSTTLGSQIDRAYSFFGRQQEQLAGHKGKPVPGNWEHAHNHCIMTYRLYYKGDELDPSFPAAVLAKEIVVPAEKPKATSATHYSHIQSAKPAAKEGGQDGDEPALDVAAILGESNPVDERRKILVEVREHLDLLKEFEGVISEDELAKRKRDLFLAMPQAPSPSTASPNKKPRAGL